MKSDWKQSAIDRKEPLESDEWKKGLSPKRRKLAKKWCRGKFGLHHIPAYKKISWANGRECAKPSAKHPWDWSCYHELVCVRCGKIIQWHVSWRDCPDIRSRKES